MKAYLNTEVEDESLKVKIAFGSCFNPLEKEHSIFKDITRYDPQIFIWLGDFAYTDHKVFQGYFEPGSQSFRKKMFDMTQNQENYAEFRKGNRLIVGTMDDHDYGLNNAGANNPVKDQNKRLFLEALNERPDSPRWAQGRGLEEDYQILYGNFKIRLILLDTRYYMEKAQTPGSAFLGEKQWKWLEKVLTQTHDDLYILASGVQIMQNIVSLPKEAWPAHEKHRLFSLIERYRKARVVLISGDIHFYQYYKTPCPIAKNAYYIYEMTSSGLSHVGNTRFSFANKFIETFSPKTYMLSPKLGTKLNFGVIEVFGAKRNKTISLQIRGLHNKLYKKLDLQLNDLNFDYARSEPVIFDCRFINFHNKIGNDFMNMVGEMVSGENMVSYGVALLLTTIFSFFVTVPGFFLYRLAFCFKQSWYRRKAKPQSN